MSIAPTASGDSNGRCSLDAPLDGTETARIRDDPGGLVFVRDDVRVRGERRSTPGAAERGRVRASAHRRRRSGKGGETLGESRGEGGGEGGATGPAETGRSAGACPRVGRYEPGRARERGRGVEDEAVTRLNPNNVRRSTVTIIVRTLYSSSSSASGAVATAPVAASSPSDAPSASHAAISAWILASSSSSLSVSPCIRSTGASSSSSSSAGVDLPPSALRAAGESSEAARVSEQTSKGSVDVRPERVVRAADALGSDEHLGYRPLPVRLRHGVLELGHVDASVQVDLDDVRVNLRVLLRHELLHRAAVGAVGLADDDDAVRADGVREHLGFIGGRHHGDAAHAPRRTSVSAT